ncbi:MAG: FecR domain-containing protein, partial [Lachnospiraceae bacterium]|nr:FecR domain-containing protein [Lachnospiraceae bacterium]
METKTVGSANSGEGRKNGPSKKTVVAICVAAAVVVIGLVIFFVIRANSSLRASTVRFLRMQGIVELLNEKEKAISITENMRLKSGNKVRTDSQSFASLGLDDYKLISLEEKSKVVIEQKGKKLELNLENGSLYFNVTKALEEDETFNISTSTMIMGIRGTCGYINADEIFLVEGHVTIMDKDGNLIEVEEGQWLIRDRSTGKFVIKKFKMKELPLLIISELARDDTRRAEMLELCGVSEEEFWEYADTLEPAYFDWADLGRKRPESEAEPESKTEPEPAVTEPEKAPESETAVAEETTPEEAVPGETTEEAEPGEQTAKEPPEEAAQEETGDTFKITVNRVEGGTVVPSATSAKAGDVITLTVTPYNHYTLVGWNISSSAVSLPSPDTVQSPSFVMPAENITISAVFKYSVPENSFTVSIGSATGGSASADSTMVEQGAMVTITATPDTGYSFAGWTVTGGSATLSDSSAASTTFTMPAENVTITPAFTANNYTISVAAGTGGSASASASSAAYGTA